MSESQPSTSRPFRINRVWLGILLIACVAAAALVATRRRAAPVDTRGQQAYQAGLEALKAKKLDEAAARFDEAEKLGFDQTKVERGVGLMMMAAHLPDQAEPMLARAWSRTTEPDPDLYQALATLLLQTYRLDRAFTVLERWAKEAPRDARPLVMLAEIDIRKTRTPELVLKRYREAIDRDPANADARLGAAEQLHLLGNEAEAIKEYQAHLASHPDDFNPAAYFGLGRAYQLLGEDDKAIEALRKANELTPNKPEILARLAALMLRKNQPKEALELAEQAVKLDPFDPENRYVRATVWSHLGRTSEAKAEFDATNRLRDDVSAFNELRQKLADRPDEAPLLVKAAVWLKDHGRGDEAIAWAKLALVQDANSPEANRVLADIYQDRGEAGLANLYRLKAGK